MMGRTYDPATNTTTIVLEDGTVVVAQGRHDAPQRRDGARKRKDRHVPRGRMAAASEVERISALASDGMLMMSRHDRAHERHERGQARRERKPSPLSDRDRAMLALVRATLPPA